MDIGYVYRELKIFQDQMNDFRLALNSLVIEEGGISLCEVCPSDCPCHITTDGPNDCQFGVFADALSEMEAYLDELAEEL